MDKRRKKLEKEIKKGQKQLFEKKKIARTDTLTAKKALKKYPEKTQKQEKPLMDAVVKSMKLKKKKAAHKASKRTTPGEVDHRESSPAHIHPEGGRWNKTLKQQNQTKRKALTNKLQRQHKSNRGR